MFTGGFALGGRDTVFIKSFLNLAQATVVMCVKKSRRVVSDVSKNPVEMVLGLHAALQGLD